MGNIYQDANAIPLGTGGSSNVCTGDTSTSAAPGGSVTVQRTGETQTQNLGSGISSFSITTNTANGDYQVALNLPFPPPDPENAWVCACNADPSDPYRCLYTSQTPVTGNSGTNFFIKRANTDNTAWFQTLGGSAFASGSIESRIPFATCTPPLCTPALIATDPAGTVDSPGFALIDTGEIVTSASGGVYIHGSGTRSNASQATGLGVRVPMENYAFFFAKFGDRAQTLSTAGKPVQQPGLGIYRYNGNMIIDHNNPWSVANNEQIIVFVDGDLTIDDTPGGENRLTTVAPGGSGFLMFIVRGNIRVSENVGYTNISTNPNSANIANLEGVFVANGTFTVASAGSIVGGGGGGSGLATNLYSYWKLNETTGDRTDAAGSYNLQAQNAPTSAAGKIGNALSVASASQQRVRGEHSATPDLSANGATLSFTFSGWFKTTTTSGSQVLYGKRSSISGGAGYSTHLNGNGQIVCRVNNGTTEYATNQNNESSNANGAWHHVACVVNRSNNTLTEYVDGVQTQSVSISGNFNSSNHFFIGSVGDHANPFNGQLDEFGFWRGRALTSGEVAQLYNNGSGLSYEAIIGGGATSDRKFIGAGTFVGWGGVVLERDYGGGVDPTLNNTAPTEVFIFRPDFIVNAPREVKSAQMTWREVEPQF